MIRDSSMRIAIVHYTAPPVIGGVERIIAGQARAMIAAGHEVTIVCGNADASVPGVRVAVASELSRQPCAPLSTVLADHEVVIVHNLFTMPFNLPATQQLRQLAVEWNKVHWINWVHDIAAVNPAYAHLPWDHADYAMLRQPAPNCTHVAVSEVRRREYLDLLRLPDSACVVVPNGIDVDRILNLTPRIAALADELRLWDRDYVVLHPTRVLRRKNIEQTLRITHALSAPGLDVTCLITGAPDPHNADTAAYATELQGLITDLGLHHTAYFLGQDAALSDDDVRSLYALADALVFPSKSEGFGLPLLEGALHGVPVFCSDIPAHREVGQGMASFFDLDEDPALTASSIMDHARVTERYHRRHVIGGSLAWPRVYEMHLEPLLRRR
jgi:glycosyltransferase involved in cell wall biosynthesis